MKNFLKIILAIIMVAALFIVGINSGLISVDLFKNHPGFKSTSFEKLPGWQTDDHRQALQAFLYSCQAIAKRDPALHFSSIPNSGTVGDWQTVCAAANQVDNSTDLAARQFFEHWFQPYAISNNFNSNGKFTGYYFPVIRGSLTADKQYSVPIYELPNDLVKINLGLFQFDWAGKNITGHLVNGEFLPYPSRAEINDGAIKNHAKVIAWSNSSIDLFFLQIQGSGIIQLPNGKQIIAGYAGSNGYPYTSIGKILIEQKALTLNTVSMQSIRAWLLQHPDKVNDLLNKNASYTFFKILPSALPVGTQQVPLTPKHSIAVDTSYIPLGAPLWLSTTAQQDENIKQATPFQHLLIAQDTGGAIKGVVRGDIYWGSGTQAEFAAGHLKSSGRYWILLPRLPLLILQNP